MAGSWIGPPERPARPARSRVSQQHGCGRSGWTTTRSASTRPGTGTSPWPWSPWRSWPSPAPDFLLPTTGSGGGRGDRAGRAGRALRRRVASAAGLPGLAPTGRPGVHPRLVGLASPSSGHRSTHPLPATTRKTATVGLEVVSQRCAIRDNPASWRAGAACSGLRSLTVVGNGRQAAPEMALASLGTARQVRRRRCGAGHAYWLLPMWPCTSSASSAGAAPRSWPAL
jgi:hypothetical protein